MKLYKVLNSDMTSPFQGFPFEFKKYKCNDFDINLNNHCSNGFYAVELEGLPYSFGIDKKIFRVDVNGKSVEIDQYKRRYEEIEIIKEIPHSTILARSRKLNKNLGYNLSEVLFPLNPLLLNRKRVTKRDIEKLIEWNSVRASVRASVRDSVWNSVRASVWASVWNSVRASVRDSVWDSVWNSVRDSVGNSGWNSVWDSVGNSVRDSVGAYISSMFPNIKQWKYIKHEKGINPYQGCIDLWKSGLVPSYDGKIWRLHSGKDAKILYELDNLEEEK